MTTNNQHHYSSRRASVAAAPALQLRNSLLRISCAVSLKVLLLIVLGVPFLRPLAVSAHEVYVLDHAEISRALTTDSPNPFSVLPEQEKLFLTYGAAIAFGVIIILFLSVSPLFERVCNPWLSKLKPWAPLIARVTLGLSIIASGYYGAIFGPELPLTQIVSPDFVPLLGIVLVYAGVFIMLGLLTRIVSVLGVILFAILICVDHTYMLTYASYLGEFILFVILGGGAHSLDEHVPFLNKVDNYSKKFRKRLEPYSFLIMRILFGVSVFFASFYSKFLHSNLALATVTEYHLTDFFHFTPLRAGTRTCTA